MLSQLVVRNLAVARELALELGPGMTTLTGETGAGKSILIDALGLSLGVRANAGQVRAGAPRAEVIAVFELQGLPELEAWLGARELATEDLQCILRRVVTRDGRSKAFINDRPVSLQSLREAGEQLVDIHGQHAHQSLLRRETQREILDATEVHDRNAGTLLAQVGKLAKAWRGIEAEIAQLDGLAEHGGQQADYLRFQLGELKTLALGPKELAELDQEQRRLSHAHDLVLVAGRSLTRLEEESGARDALGEVIRRLDEVAHLDPRLTPALRLLRDAQIPLDEALSELRQYSESVELDPARLQAVDARLSHIYELARKYRVEPTQLADLEARLSADLERILGSEARREALLTQLDEVRDEYREASGRLTHHRRDAAVELSKVITGAMQNLGMTGGQFEISVTSDSELRPSPNGTDRIEFLVTTNPGQAPLPLAKVVSGGELSRISLAIQVNATQASGVPTLIFDEVDVGVGGALAETIGLKLKALAEHRQVLCVTHQPQVAAVAEHHVQVRKTPTEPGSVRTQIAVLDATDRVEEIARMLGGLQVTAQTRAHAEELLQARARPSRGL